MKQVVAISIYAAKNIKVHLDYFVFTVSKRTKIPSIFYIIFRSIQMDRMEAI